MWESESELEDESCVRPANSTAGQGPVIRYACTDSYDATLDCKVQREIQYTNAISLSSHEFLFNYSV
jgi:hypothetical protein